MLKCQQIVGSLTLMSRINLVQSLVEQGKSFITLGPVLLYCLSHGFIVFWLDIGTSVFKVKRRSQQVLLCLVELIELFTHP